MFYRGAFRKVNPRVRAYTKNHRETLKLIDVDRKGVAYYESIEDRKGFVDGFKDRKHLSIVNGLSLRVMIFNHFSYILDVPLFLQKN